MNLHRAAREGFSANAEVYGRGRPEYPASLDHWLRSELGVERGRSVVELGAGTGKFTRKLVGAGARVLAVEPVAAMAEQMHRQSLDGVEILNGVAEAIPLPDACCDAVVCAQSFHWFASAQVLAEIHRVLRPGGALGLVWNVRDQKVAWVAALTEIMLPFEGNTPRYESQVWRRVFPASGFSALREEHFPHEHTGAPEQVIVERVLSVSFIAALGAKQQACVRSRLLDLIRETPELAGKSTVRFPYSTIAFSCRKVGD